ncbi:MAG: hypothetical protein O3A95_01940 [Planctomycetota bacterium]|nr:hypothetical protein [Planctomycetota bacterium]
MRTALLSILILGLGLALFPDFSDSMVAQEPAPVEEVDVDSDPAAELALLKRDLAVAKLRMEHLLSEQELNRLETEMEHAEAVANLQQFNVYGRAAAMEQAALDLLYSKDELADSEEELRQLSMMYEANNLADATAQIVMDRANRGIERQRKALEIATKENANWIEFGLPRKFSEIKNAEILAAAQMNLMFLTQTLALKEMEIEINDLEKQIKELATELQESSD